MCVILQYFATRLAKQWNLPRAAAADSRSLPIIFGMNGEGTEIRNCTLSDVQVTHAAIFTSVEFISELVKGQIPAPPAAAYTFRPLDKTYTLNTADIRGRPIELKVSRPSSKARCSSSVARQCVYSVTILYEVLRPTLAQ